MSTGSVGVGMSVDSLGNVTSADLQVVARCEIIAPQGVVVEGFADNEAINQDAGDFVESRMGVDGFFAAGFVWREKVLTMTLMPHSPFIEILRQCRGMMRNMVRPLQWDIDVTYPSLRGYGVVYNFRTGVYANGAELTAARNTLDNVTAHLGLPGWTNTQHR